MEPIELGQAYPIRVRGVVYMMKFESATRYVTKRWGKGYSVLLIRAVSTKPK